MIQSTDGFPLNFGFTGEPSLVSSILLFLIFHNILLTILMNLIQNHSNLLLGKGNTSKSSGVAAELEEQIKAGAIG